MTPLERITAAVDELIEPRTHREALAPGEAPKSARTGKTIHGAVLTHVPSLLDQLDHVPPGGGVERGQRIPGSRPQAHLDALDTLIEIDHESARAILDLGGTDRGTTEANLRALIGLATGHPDDDIKDLSYTAWAWRTRAAVITGWELPARTPNNTCPVCDHRGTLRVRVDTSTGTGTGFCLNCRTAWDEQQIGLLAEHIRYENSDLIICARDLNQLLTKWAVSAA